MDKPLAIIVSNSLQRCEDFLKKHRLNFACFGAATKLDTLVRVDPITPIIITYSDPPLSIEFVDWVERRFASVRFMDY